MISDFINDKSSCNVANSNCAVSSAILASERLTFDSPPIFTNSSAFLTFL